METSAQAAGAKKSPGLIILLVVVAIVAGYVGYFIGAKNAKPNMGQPIPDLTAQLPTTKVAADSIITSQEAVAVGKIVKTEAGSITMQGKDGKIGVFKLATKYNIYPLAATSSAAVKPSQDVKSIKLNENYLVHLVLQDKDFVATTIQALLANTN